MAKDSQDEVSKGARALSRRVVGQFQSSSPAISASVQT
jgi:hypothetical protein